MLRRSTALLCIAALLCAAMIVVPFATLPESTTIVRPVTYVFGLDADDAGRSRWIATPLPLLRGPPA